MRSTLALLALASAAGLVTSCGGDESSSTETTAAHRIPTGSEPVELDPADFMARIDNAYWPMAPGSRWTYRETAGDGSVQQVVVTITDRTKRIAGIEATVVHDVVSEQGEVAEDTFDWYAQDKAGNVWYLGEDTKEYENGKLKTTEGSWEAEVDGAQAGIVVLAQPKVGMAYRQEHYAGEAEDRGKVLSLDERAQVPFGSFDRLLMTADTTPLEPKVLEHKYYAEGVGPVLTISVSGGGDREELVSFRRGR
jgi:hypothetical protein